MKGLGKDEKGGKILAAMLRFFGFFSFNAFIITCCMLLFLRTMEQRLAFTEAEIRDAAVLTFVNVILLSLLCAVVNAVQRHFNVERPVNRIVQAAEKIMQGDLSVRIQKKRSIDPNDGFNTIIGYFNRMAEELSGIETLRTDFIANVSHELKTPLAVIQNYGTMLQQAGLPEEGRIEYARAVTDAAGSLASMVSNILKLNKLENQKIYPATSTFDLGVQLGECLVAWEDVWDKKGLEIEADLDEGVMVRADPELLTLVWNNLFANAIKFTDPGGRVFLSLKTEGDCAVVRVSDTGCGISPEVGRHIFEKFYQGDASHSTKGNGLGLALVKRVIDITDGDISVSSEVGRGSTFMVKLKREQNGEA